MGNHGNWAAHPNIELQIRCDRLHGMFWQTVPEPLGETCEGIFTDVCSGSHVQYV